MKKHSLSASQRILVAFTLFGMFFGAGNLIFPVLLGQLAGKNFLPAIIGFVITAVGIPILGVAAIGITHSDGLQDLSAKVGKGYSYFFTCLLYLTIGPFFAIPRCATVSFSTGISPLLTDTGNEWLFLLIFSFLFFALVLFFSLRPGKITVWIGKIINPLFLAFFAILLIAVFIQSRTPLSAVIPDKAYETKAFFKSFIDGYGTMDAIAGLAFGIVVIDIIRGMGIQEDEAIAKDVFRSGLLTGVLMILIYVLSILMGTVSRGVMDSCENGGIALGQISKYYLGSTGSIILAITITFACLKTSIGLVTSCSETFAKMFPGKLSYTAWAVIFTVFSFGISNFGLTSILNYSLPVLMFLYPLAITLILLALLGKYFNHDRKVYISVTVFTLLAALFDFIKTLPENMISALHLEKMVSFGRTILPLFDLDLGWIIPALAGLCIGLILHFSIRKGKQN